MTQATGPSPTPDRAAARARQHRLVLAVMPGLMAAMFLSALEQTIMSTSIRTIADSLGGLSLQAWATTAYLVTSTIAAPVYGKLSDIYGRKPVYLVSIAVFLLGSLTCTFAQSMYQLAAFRGLQGLGGGGLMALAFAITADLVPPRDRARYQGYFMAVWIAASVCGPTVGGVLAGADRILGLAGWRWVFLVNLPIGLLAMAVIAKVLDLEHHRQKARIDVWGGVTITIGLVPLLVLFDHGRDWGWSSPVSLGALAVGLAGLAAFAAVEKRAGDDALIPLRLFRIPTYRTAILTALTVGVGMFGAVSLVPLYMQLARDATPMQSGLVMLPMMGGIMIATVVSGALISRHGRYKILPVAGAAVTAVGMFAFSYVGIDTPVWIPLLLVLFFGIGIGNCTQAVTVAAQNAVAARDTGVATASLMFLRQMAGALGVALFLSVLFGTLGGNMTAAVSRATADPAVAAAIHDPAVAAAPRNRPFFDLLHGGQDVSVDSSFLHTMDPVLVRPFREAFAESLNVGFLVGSATMLLTLALALCLKEVPLREISASEALAQEAEAEAAARDGSGRTADEGPA
ncbi:MDR family MFS transporter [Streptomyces sp. NPDC017056]|uniref:MDR family MFS transporter n=1 Tax=Streptomyces sp. NPDC017056 TaxID=3364973 RepID=UPI0037B7089D